MERSRQTYEVRAGDIAIVGFAGRFPGAPDTGALWSLLRDGREAISFFSPEELAARGVPAELLADPAFVPASAILDGFDQFDAAFFGMSPREAAIMDPQHRQFLEVSWEALEHAACDPAAFPGSIGVFAGCGMNAYMMRNLMANDKLIRDVGLFLIRHTGNDKDFLASRVSYEFDLTGPSVSVQTACSTSLVATHMACQSLVAGECDMALAGGVSIEIPHGLGYLYLEGEILSRDGHCRPFDANSSGTVFSSGAGVVVLRRLADAIRDGDYIHGIIRGSAVNNDGAGKAGYLAPGVEGQSKAIAEAIAVADLDASSVSYVEAHGTGTPVGDPIEVLALTKAFREWTSATSFCALGSLKSNLGHMDVAAGVAGLIKVVLSMRHRQLPGTRHFNQPNPLIRFAETPFFVSSELRCWDGPAPLRAGVSSLGVGGTNAHVVVEEGFAPDSKPSRRPLQLLPVSARSATALDRMSATLAGFLRQEDPNLADAAFTLQTGRRGFAFRRVAVASDCLEASRAFDGQGMTVYGVAGEEPLRTAFLFPGGGAQHAAMGRELYEREPVFRKALEDCRVKMRSATGLDLFLPMFRSDTSDSALERASLGLPALFAVEFALAQLWRSWGIQPAMMLGHSLGEYVAACLAGVFDLESALALVHCRGRLFETLPPGAMLSVNLPSADLRTLLKDSVSVAAENGNELSVASGPEADITELQERLASRGVDCRRVRIQVAAHSAMLEPILEEFQDLVARLSFSRPAEPFLSNVTGGWADAEAVTRPEYWVRHLRGTVRFSACLRTALETGPLAFLEVGPGQTLTALARTHQGANAKAILSSLPRAQDSSSEHRHLLCSLAQLWCLGASVDWRAMHGDEYRLRIPLPGYHFEHQRFWIDRESTTFGRSEQRQIAGGRLAESDWCSKQVWEELPSPARETDVAGRHWLLFGADEALAGCLAAQGAMVTRVVPGSGYRQIRPDLLECDPVSRADWDLVLAASLKRSPVTGIVHAWNVAPGPDPEQTAFHSWLVLLQSFGSELQDHRLQLVTATVLVHDAAGSRPENPHGAMSEAVMKVAAREFPNWCCRTLDLDEWDPLLVAAECAHPNPVSGTVALRAGRRYRPRLVSAGELPENGVSVRYEGVYLITGGTGGVGMAIAKHLTRHYRARLVLLSRGLDAPHTADRIRDLAGDTGEVEVVRGDVADRAALERAIAFTLQRFGKLHGVIHAAGVMNDQPILLKTISAASAVLKPKVAGTLLVADAVANLPLDFLALFASTSADLGPGGQVDYAAANAFLNAFALSSTLPFPVVSINWGAWKGVGMTATPHAGAPLHPPSGHPLAGTVQAVGEHVSAEQVFSVGGLWPLEEHQLSGGRAVLPGMACLEMIRAASATLAGGKPIELEDGQWRAPLMMTRDASRLVRTALDHEPSGEFRVSIQSWGGAETGGQLHFQGTLRLPRSRPPLQYSLADISRRCRMGEVDFQRGQLKTRQERFIEFGPRWRCIHQTRLGDSMIFARIELDPGFFGDLDVYELHPALLDAATGFCLPLIRGYEQSDGLYVPMSFRKVRIDGRLPAKLFGYAECRNASPELAEFDIRVMDESGKVLVEFQRLAYRRVDPNSVGQSTSPEVETGLIALARTAGIPPAMGGAAFERALRAGLRKIIVSSIDLERLERTISVQLSQATRGEQSSEAYIAPRNPLEEQIAGIWSALLGVEKVSVRENFFSLGGHSLLAIRLFSQLKKVTGRELPLSRLFENPTVESLATELGGEAPPPVWSALVPIQPEGSLPPLYCIHGMGGTVVEYADLARHLGNNQPVYGFQARGLDGKQPMLSSVEAMAAHYLDELREFQPEGPYYMGGSSFGGLVAYEMAQQLIAAGQRVGVVALFDTFGPGYPRQLRTVGRIRRVWNRWLFRLSLHSTNLRLLEPEDRRAYLQRVAANAVKMFRRSMLRGRRSLQDRWRWMRLSPALRRQFALTGEDYSAGLGIDVPAHLVRLQEGGIRAAELYRPAPLDAPVILFRATDQPRNAAPDPTNGWQPYLPKLKVIDVPGHHGAIIRNPRAAVLASLLRSALQTHRDQPADEIESSSASSTFTSVSGVSG
ncbi:MAG: SDR family NAD(P)-dependent oxidoreductase [Bryobacteraceae bacterium]|nr:SDR family NAD(P)-dependent oxidoreductase [Bryobacteraceae bacterium]